MNFIDLGLPSGTLWAAENEKGFYTFAEAVIKYSNCLPTKEQLEELKAQCQWEWVENEYRITGPNGNSVVLPAAGFRGCVGGVYCVGSDGFYWSSTPNVSDDAWRIRFDSIGVVMYIHYRCYGLSVRLVKNTNNNMENKEINIAEILKDCPKGTKLYSTICGECELDTVDTKRDFPIDVIYKNANNYEDVETFTKDGKYRYVGECVLFPSKENRDWSTFKAPKKEYEFKPFERVLVRDSDGEEWHSDLFSHLHTDGQHKCIGGWYNQCIPYEGNEHLLGTCDSPNEE